MSDKCAKSEERGESQEHANYLKENGRGVLNRELSSLFGSLTNSRTEYTKNKSSKSISKEELCVNVKLALNGAVSGEGGKVNAEREDSLLGAPNLDA